VDDGDLPVTDSIHAYQTLFLSLSPFLPSSQVEAFLSQTWRMKEVFQAVTQHSTGSQKVRLLKRLQRLGIEE
jgi:hypothetical protein